MRFVLVMAAREMRASWRRLVFFFLCIAIGVGAIVALRSVIQSVRAAFAGEARALIAADASFEQRGRSSGEVAAQIDARLRGGRRGQRRARSRRRRWRGRRTRPTAARGWWSCGRSGRASRTTAR